MSEAGLNFDFLYKEDPALKDLDVAKYRTLGSDADIAAVKAALEAKTHKVSVVENGAAALELLKNAIPAGASVNTGHSTSLIEIGFVEHLKVQTAWDNIHGKQLAETDPAKKAALAHQGITPNYFVVGASAITKTGEIVSGDLTGTRVNGILGADNVILLVGANKIVADEAAGLDRLHTFCHAVESARSRIVYKVAGSYVNNVVVVRGANPWGAPGRIHVVIVKESLGF